MTVEKYQIEARLTAMYPHNMSYPILGLMGELGEYFESNCMDTKEAGDICWYVANIATDYGIRLESSKIVPFGLLITCAGKIAEMQKKFIRDGKAIDLDKVSMCLHGILFNLAHHNLSEIMQANIDKLLSRKERGVLQGDGNNR